MITQRCIPTELVRRVLIGMFGVGSPGFRFLRRTDPYPNVELTVLKPSGLLLFHLLCGKAEAPLGVYATRQPR